MREVFYAQCTFSASLAIFEIIKQNGCVQCIFKLSHSAINHNLQTTTTLKNTKKFYTEFSDHGFKGISVA
jgi:hypothetical protein